MDQNKKRVGVIFGGRSSEREVSLATGRYVFSLVDPARFTAIAYYMDGDGSIWNIPRQLAILNTTADVELKLGKLGTKIRYEELQEQIDVMFIALLGKYGEDGCIQGVLELLNIPYTGSGVLASALAMDKKIHKEFLKAQGFKVPRDRIIERDYWQSCDQSAVSGELEESLGLPLVIKPTREGSSIGVSVVKERSKIPDAIARAMQWDREVLIEEYIKGLEFTCVVFGNDNPQAMLPTEIVFEGDFFTYEGKYMPGRTQTITPPRLPEEVVKCIQDTAVLVYKTIGCRGYGRVDGFVVGTDIYVSEPHTGSIMVPSSFVFQQASKFKIQLVDEFRNNKTRSRLTPRMLVTRIIESAVDAHKSKKGPL